jgi:serine/threonine protein phosphatase PrpC
MLRIVEEAARTDTGRQRHANEDSYYARSPIYVVADGMGGAQAGEVASRIAADVFDEDMGDGNPEEQLAERAQEANRRIFERARADASHSGMGTTLTGALVSDDEVSIVHVGDSRAYLFREGELRQLTRDHSLVEELRRRGQLTPEEAEEHPQRSIITRALGPEPEVELDVHTHQARAGDVFLLCSDGLTSMVREERLREILTGARTLDEAVDRLVNEANEAGGRDNITVVAFRVGDDDMDSHSPDETVTDLRKAAGDGEGPPTREAIAAEVAPEAPPPAPPPAPPDLPPRAPRRPAPVSREPRRPRRRGRRMLVTVLVLAVLAGATAGALAGLHSAYFVGSDRGLVTLYRGLPYDLPFGIHLYETRYVSSVPVQALTPTERRRLLDHQLRSKNDAADLVRKLERGRGL